MTEIEELKAEEIEFEEMIERADGWSDWIHPSHSEGRDSYLMKCCGCGLVHKLQFEIAEHVDDGFALWPGEGPETGVIIFRAARA